MTTDTSSIDGILNAKLDALEKRVREQARDAARYRWLRSASVTNGAIDPDDDDFWNDLGDLLDEKFDAAIDAARKAKPCHAIALGKTTASASAP